MADHQEWCRRMEGDWVLSLYVQPGARKTEPVGLHDGCLKLRLAAPPVDGKANAALTAYLADWFGVPKNRVLIKSGELSRRKVVTISGSNKDPASLLSV